MSSKINAADPSGAELSSSDLMVRDEQWWGPPHLHFPMGAALGTKTCCHQFASLSLGCARRDFCTVFCTGAAGGDGSAMGTWGEDEPWGGSSLSNQSDVIMPISSVSWRCIHNGEKSTELSLCLLHTSQAGGYSHSIVHNPGVQ